ncbi:MAG: PIN domain-containing protein [Acidobacteriota bacterium]|jgi:predicted nucleic acid-binding protein|nr:PIN domain-containing protein [Acidobacteriota bacterium]
MIYALDTNIISYLLRGDTGVTQRWRRERTQGNPSVIPTIAYYEVKRGLVAANAKSKLEAFERLCGALNVDYLTIEDVDVASRIYAERKTLGRPIEDADLLIAAQSVSRGYKLVTNNLKHFELINGLKLVNWAE